MGTTAPHGNHRSSWERVAPLHRGPPWLPRWPPEVSPAPRPAPPRPYPRPAPPPPAPPGEQVFGIALVSDFFLLVTGVAGSCFYCKRRPRSRCALGPWGSYAPCSALCAPACGIGCDRPFGARGAYQAPLTTLPTLSLAAARLPPPCVGPLPPFQPSLSPAIPPTFRQRGAFAAADERAKGTVHFSDNDKKFGKKGRGRKDKGRAREIQLTNMRNAL